jgi:hypothetical protein
MGMLTPTEFHKPVVDAGSETDAIFICSASASIPEKPELHENLVQYT